MLSSLKTLVIGVAAVALLSFSEGAANAQIGPYDAYGSPYVNDPVVGTGTYYNGYNFGYSYPYLSSYIPWGSYYNYVNSFPGYGYGYGPYAGYGGGYFGGPRGFGNGYYYHGHHR